MDTLRPLVVRVRLYLAGSNEPRFSTYDLDALVARGDRTMIINPRADAIDPAALAYQIRDRDIGGGTVMQWAARNANVTVYVELGNEPDREGTWANRAHEVRDTTLNTWSGGGRTIRQRTRRSA